MEKNQINQSTVRWLKRRFKDLSDTEIIERATKITKKYLIGNQDKLENERKVNQVLFDEVIDKELLSLKLFGTN